MNKSKIFTFASILLLLILSVGMVCASDDVADELSDSNDDDIVCVDDESQDFLSSSVDVTGDKFSDIQKSINSAKEKDVINLNGTYTGESNPIKISKSLTIQSSGKVATLDAGNNSRIFTIEKGDVTFKNIIFTNGVSNKGGAIYSLGNCKFINCKFINNYGEDGGAIYSQNSITLTNTVLENNFARSSGGAIYCPYSLNKNSSKSKVGNVDIDGCTFTNNKANSGGAINIETWRGNDLKNDKYGIVTIKNSNFVKNSGEEFGGAIDFSGSTTFGKLIVDKSNFTQNYADEGSAIDLRDSPLTLSNSNFNKNTGNLGTVYIGFDSVSKIKNCNFISNSLDSVSGVVVYCAQVSLVDCKFQSNSLPAISNYDSGSVLKITNGKNTKTYKKLTVLDNSLKTCVTITVKAKNVKSTYDSAEKFTVQLINKYTKKPVKFFEFNLHFKNGKKEKVFRRTTNKDGKLTLRFLSNLPVGKYEVTYESDCWGLIDGSKHTVIIKKAKATVKAPKVTAKYKKSKYFKVTIKDSKKERLYKVKVKVKVYTGKKAKTYNLKTNYNGVAKLKTNKLSKGSHKVKIKSADPNYKFSAKSKIKIK